MKTSGLTAALALVSTVSAHIAITYPPPFRASNNPNSVQSTIDYSLTSPLNADGSNFPCKGYLSDLSGPGGKSVATWQAGAALNFTTGSGATHEGGSCQIALSYDQGKSFTVIHSYIGNCPINAPQSFQFTLPSDAPAGAAVFAWVWYNKVGNREIYMDCASVTITGGSTNKRSTSFSARPGLFVANLGNGCTTVEGQDVNYPNPGPDVTGSGSGTGFTGTCAAVKGIGGSSSGGGSSAPSSAASNSNAPLSSLVVVPSSPSTVRPSKASASAGIFNTMASSASTAPTYASPPTAASSSVSSGNALSISADGECSGSHTCAGSSHGPCCSQWGWCGSTDAHCGTGCQAVFGQCGSTANSSLSAGPSSPLAQMSSNGGTSVSSMSAVSSMAVTSPTPSSIVIISSALMTILTLTETMLSTLYATASALPSSTASPRSASGNYQNTISTTETAAAGSSGSVTGFVGVTESAHTSKLTSTSLSSAPPYSYSPTSVPAAPTSMASPSASSSSTTTASVLPASTPSYSQSGIIISALSSESASSDSSFSPVTVSSISGSAAASTPSTVSLLSAATLAPATFISGNTNGFVTVMVKKSCQARTASTTATA